MWYWKAIVLCALSVAAIFALGAASGSTTKQMWRLLTTGAMKEFLSPEGRLCLCIGGLFGMIMLLAVFAPNLIAFMARVVDPASFGPPKEAPSVAIWLLFFYCLGNVCIVGWLYAHPKH